MLLKNEKITVVIEGYTIRSHKIPGVRAQFMLDTTGIIGWFDGVEMRRSAVARPVGGGDFAERGRNGSRVISITGLAEADSRAVLHQMRDDFTSILNHGNFSELKVTSGAGVRYATVGLSSAPSFVIQTDTFATFKLDLYSPTPEIYGPKKTAYLPGMTLLGGLGYPLTYPLQFNAPVKLQSTFAENDGNASAWPIFKVTGDYLSGFTVTNGQGRKVTYRGAVSSSAPVFIDMGQGSAIQNNVDKSYNLSERDWFAIEPGTTIQPQFIPLDGGSGWCDIIYRDTWI